MAPSAASSPVTVPTRPDPGAIAALTDLLEAVDFTEAGLCARLGLPDIYAFQPAGPGRDEPRDVLDLLILLLLDGMAVDEEELRRFVPDEGRAALEALELLTHREDGRCHANVVLYPTRSLYLVSDSPVDPLTGRTRESAPDAVYPAITEATRDFVTALPPHPRGRFLELCSGTGIGALLAARSAEEAWAVDITERSTRFAAFNAALNGLENVIAVEGDLYEPLEGRSFDTIAAHPPYMQSEEVREIYRDGGTDGEEVTRRIVAGLGRHLAPGGRFHCTCMLTDREGTDLEERIREMLGPDADDFDLLLMPLGSMDPRKAVFDEAVRGRATLEQSRRRDALYRELGVRELVYCSMALQRRTASRPARTLRRPRRPETDGAAIEWLLEWELEPEVGLSPDELAASTPSTPEHVGARSELILEDGHWRHEHMTIETAWPFPASVRCAPWVLELMARCDGTRTVSAVLDSLRRDGLLAEEAPREGLLDMVRSLVSAGFLTIPEHPLPPRARPTRTRP